MTPLNPPHSPKLLDAQRSILLVVDIQEKFLPIIRHGKRILSSTSILLEAAHRLSIPVVVTEQYPKGLGHTVDDLQELLGKTQAQVIEKSSFGVWGEPCVVEAFQALTDAGRNQVVVVGLETHVCVNQSVCQLLGAGYEVYVIQDGVSSRSRDNHKVGLAKMVQAGAATSCVEMALFEWMGASTHEQFKPIQALIK